MFRFSRFSSFLIFVFFVCCFVFDILFFIMYTIYVFKIKQDDEKVNTDFAFSSSCIILSLCFCAL